jgi:hypothetical protein
MPVRRGLTAAILAPAATLVLAGCGQSAREQVHAKVEEFVAAVAHKDYKTLCDDVFAQVLLVDLREGGLKCTQAMQIALTRVHAPSLAIGRITVKGNTAKAVTLSTAKGQEAALTALELIRTSGGWRVTSLGSPLP